MTPSGKWRILEQPVTSRMFLGHETGTRDFSSKCTKKAEKKKKKTTTTTTTAAKRLEALTTNLMMNANPSPYRLLNSLIPKRYYLSNLT